MTGRFAAGVAGMAMIGALVTAAPASADNASYLGAVSPRLTSKGGNDALLAVGKDSCRLLRPSGDLMFGRHPNLVAQMEWEANPGLEREDASFVVNAAIDNLCPGVNPWGYAG